jgi:hypothetical protein
MVSLSQTLTFAGLVFDFLSVLISIQWRWRFLSYEVWKERRIAEMGSLLKEQYQKEKAEYQKDKKAIKILLTLLLTGTTLQIIAVFCPLIIL